jgi:hypothetical protein
MFVSRPKEIVGAAAAPSATRRYEFESVIPPMELLDDAALLIVALDSVTPPI